MLRVLIFFDLALKTLQEVFLAILSSSLFLESILLIMPLEVFLHPL